MSEHLSSSSVLIQNIGNGARSTGTHLVQQLGAQSSTPQSRPSRSSLQQQQSYSNSPTSPDEDPFVGCERYRKCKFLGAGASGKVYVAQDQQDQSYVAIKFLEISRVFDKYLEREILNHRELHHPHIIRFKEVVRTQHHIGIVMDWACGGSLADYLKRNGSPGLQEDLARWIFQQLIFAVDYCHRKGIANRDLKLDNTLLDWMDGQPLPLVKLCDFGYSKSDVQSAASSRVGSLFYMAPEVITNLNGTYDGKVADVWSCGVILYRMLFRKWPFADSTLPGTMAKIVNLSYTIPDYPLVSPACKDLLSCMLSPKDRRADLRTVQQHPWYLTKLLPGVQGLNDQYLAQDLSAELQPVADIQQILMLATRPQQTDLDEYDRLMDQAIEYELQKPESISLDLIDLSDM